MENDKPKHSKNVARIPSKGRRGAGASVSLPSPLAMTSMTPRSGAWVAGSDAPEKTTVRVGFMPLTDAAPVIMAALNAFGEQYGIKILPVRQTSWASVRDHLINGELDAAHALYGQIYGVQLGIGGPQHELCVLMGLNHNGQAITLSNRLRDEGVVDGATLAGRITKNARDCTFAQTFPTGTHAMWLYYWLAAQGIHPLADVTTITVPPPQMLANMRLGHIDGFCVGEPWNNRAIRDNIGFTVATSQDIWADHPEKVLGTTPDWVSRYPNTARALVASVLDAGRWIDASLVNRQKTAEAIVGRDFLNTDTEVIVARMLGRYQNGLGKSWDDKHHMWFFHDGGVNFPYLSDAMWFMTQQKRWGLLAAHPRYLEVARRVNRIDIYEQGAAAAGVALPGSAMRTHRLIDGVIWDGANPAAYADSFSINASVVR